jgi:hypothetical protein
VGRDEWVIGQVTALKVCTLSTTPKINLATLQPLYNSSNLSYVIAYSTQNTYSRLGVWCCFVQLLTQLELYDVYLQEIYTDEEHNKNTSIEVKNRNPTLK